MKVVKAAIVNPLKVDPSLLMGRVFFLSWCFRSDVSFLRQPAGLPFNETSLGLFSPHC